MGRSKNISWRDMQEAPVDKDSRKELLELITDIMWYENLYRKTHLTLVASRGNWLPKKTKDLEKAHNSMLRFIPFKVFSLPLPHLIYVRTCEEVKAGIYSQVVVFF